MLFIINHENKIGHKIREFSGSSVFRVCCYEFTGLKVTLKNRERDLIQRKSSPYFCSLWFEDSDCCARGFFS